MSFHHPNDMSQDLLSEEEKLKQQKYQSKLRKVSFHEESTCAVPPCVTCRECRSQLSLDDIDTHNCKPLTPSKSKQLAIDAVKKANSFIETFLDTPIDENGPSTPSKTSVPSIEKPSKPVKSDSHSDVFTYREEDLTMLCQPEPLMPRGSFYTSTGDPLQDSQYAAAMQMATNTSLLMRYDSMPPFESNTWYYQNYQQYHQAQHQQQQQQQRAQAQQQPFRVDILNTSQTAYPPAVKVYATPAPAPAPASSVTTPLATPSLLEPSASFLSGRSTRANSGNTTATTTAVAAPVTPNKSSAIVASQLPIQCRVRGVRVNKDKVAVYTIISSIMRPALTGGSSSPTQRSAQEISIERRYREFYSFALNVYSMFPTEELWRRLPPKAYCQWSGIKNDGFLMRRKNGLDDFICRSIELMQIGANTNQGTIGQWYLVRKFFNLPSTLAVVGTTKDRSMIAAMNELKRHARQTSGWKLHKQTSSLDATYEKIADGFQMVKRVRTCNFPARAIYDMIVNKTGSSSTPSSGLVNGNETLLDCTSSTTKSTTSTTMSPWNQLLDAQEILKRENATTWTERVVYKSGWLMNRQQMEMVSLKCWKVEENGSIIIAMIPAALEEEEERMRAGPNLQKEDNNAATTTTTIAPLHRVDCVLGGWIITPTPGEETCNVTWLMQVSFGQCDPIQEFDGGQSAYQVFFNRSVLTLWANELNHLLQALQDHYDPIYYRNLGPLLSTNEIQRLKLERQDSLSIGGTSGYNSPIAAGGGSAFSSCSTLTPGNSIEDVRLFQLVQQMEPSMCLMIHKNTNQNVLLFKFNQRVSISFYLLPVP
jgi:hypothetical protein